MRAARRVSESGYYHVILRGDGKRRIFEDDDDRREFLKLLSEQVVHADEEVVALRVDVEHPAHACREAGKLEAAPLYYGPCGDLNERRRVYFYFKNCDI